MINSYNMVTICKLGGCCHSLWSRKMQIVFIVAVVIQIALLIIVFLEPLMLMSWAPLDVEGTLRERLTVVIASNRSDNIRALRQRADLSPMTIHTLEGKVDNMTGKNMEDIIKRIYIEGLKECDKVYCMILDDDVVFLYKDKDLRRILFDRIISYNNDNNYVFDCSKRGFLRWNYKVNGNGSYCRIYSRYAVRALIRCLPTCKHPVDLCLPKCIGGFVEKRFLFAQHAGFLSSRFKP